MNEASARPRRASIVVADNDPNVLDLVMTDLGFEGYDVVAAVPSGEAASEACALHHPDVLIVDYRMPPGWNGLQTIEHVLEAGTARQCLLYTNYRAPEIGRRARRMGAYYLAKGPLWTLRSTLNEMLATSPPVVQPS